MENTDKSAKKAPPEHKEQKEEKLPLPRLLDPSHRMTPPAPTFKKLRRK